MSKNFFLPQKQIIDQKSSPGFARKKIPWHRGDGNDFRFFQGFLVFL